MNIFILGFVLPILIIFLTRHFYAFYYPLNLGIYTANFSKHNPYGADENTTRNFFIINSLIFVISFVLFSALIFLPVVSYFYNWPFLLDYFPITYKLLIISYVLWLFTLVAAGYIFGHGFYDALTFLKIKGTFYYINLDETYKTLKRSPGNAWNSIQLLFDNEKKIKERTKVHRECMNDPELVKEYDQKGRKEVKEIFKSVAKLDKEGLAQIIEARKKRGNLGVFWINLKQYGGNVLFFPFMPALMFYCIITDFFVSTFSADTIEEEPSKALDDQS